MIDDENWKDEHDDLTYEERYGDSHTGVNNDGFRPRKTRPEGWLEQAIADGSVADPAVGPEPHKDYRGWDNVHVVEAPLGSIEGETASDATFDADDPVWASVTIDDDDDDTRDQSSTQRDRD